MKKILVISLAVLYLAVSSGLALEIHHCMDRIASISLIPSNGFTCGKCGMNKRANSCCKDELKFLKLADVHKVSYPVYELTAPEVSLNHAYVLQAAYTGICTVTKGYAAHSPPGDPDVSLYLLNCVFRI